MIQITPTIALEDNEIHEEFVRSSGPGGQNVNKVNTAVQLRFDVAHSPSLPEDVRARLKTLAHGSITEQGELIIDARQFRTQEANRKDALARLIALIQKAAVRPRTRYKTRPTLASKEKRLENKTRRGRTKEQRRSEPPEG